MNRISSILLVWLLMPCSSALAAYQSYNVITRMSIIEDGRTRYETRHTPTAFRLEILSDTEGVKPERIKNGRPFLTAQNGERYSIRLYNPLPVRVAVNLTVDGLNSISGKPSGIEDGDKWMIEPYSTIVIRGWQVNGEEDRRFFFTDKPKSYAKWRGDRLGRNLAANCGVIGAAYFWSQQELDRYYEEHPVYRYTQRPWNVVPVPMPSQSSSGVLGAQQGAPWETKRLARKDESQQAGTGMGERESHPTTLVGFRYDTGMYRFSEALLVYYDFAYPEPAPNPFPGLSYAPEMP